MPVTLTRSRTGDVAVVTMSGERSLKFLCRSLTSGAAFASYPALLLDVRANGALGADTRQALEQATRSCLNRKQWLAVVDRGDSIPQAVARARQWHRLVHHGPATYLGVAAPMPRIAAELWRTAVAVVRQAAPARARVPH